MIISLGQKIKEIRKLRKIKKKDFADLIGVSERTLFNYESGETIPSFNQLEKIIKVLNIPSGILFDTVEAQKLLLHNANYIPFNSEDTIDDKDLTESDFNNILALDELEQSFIKYINTLLIACHKPNLKNVHFTSDDYDNLIKYCNSSVLNIIELYYESNVNMFNLKTLNSINKENRNYE